MTAAPDATRGETTTAVDAAVAHRVRAEFAEMRGFCPTLPQAARLFNLSAAECRRVLESLVGEGVLQVTPDGCYRLITAE
jgi:hypothetical protein